MLELLSDPQAWVALRTLTALELVLGIDNIVFISILVDKLPAEQQKRARQIGLFLAMFMRVGLLMILSWIIGLTQPLFSISFVNQEISGRDLILIGGGLFLIAKATHEMHAEIEGADDPARPAAARTAFSAVIAQIVLIDLVFSIDSIVTAIGMAQDIRIMVAAVLIAVAVMYVASAPVSAFIAAHPTTKVLALAFLVLIGVALVADGFDFHVPRGYIYFAMAFAAAVEAVNITVRRRRRARRK
jgi:predicted tellurium resistance membrane protein TerC